MTGPEHYAEAERIIATTKGHDIPASAMTAVAAAAQVHAMLALTAAYAEVNTSASWLEVAQ
jgi:hypothetical protein